MSSDSKVPLKRSNAFKRRGARRQVTEPHDSSIRGASPNKVGRAASSPSKASARQQSPRHLLNQRLDGRSLSPLRESTPGSPSKQKNFSGERDSLTPPPPINLEGGPGVQQHDVTGRRSTGSRKPRLCLKIPNDPSSNTPIEQKITGNSPQKKTRGRHIEIGAKPGKRGDSTFREDLPEANNKPGPGKNTGSTDHGRAGEPQGSIWNKVIVNRGGRQAAMSQSQEETSAAMAPVRDDVPKKTRGIRKYLGHNKPREEDRNKLLSGGGD